MKRALIGLLGIAALTVAACGNGESTVSTLPDVPPTVALGDVPEPPTPISSTVAPDTVPPTTTEPEPEPITGPVGEVAGGDRLLLIGDTAMLALTRADGIACEVLSGLGWQVDIEAELGRYIRFGSEVVDELVIDVGDSWDVIGLMFGHSLDTTVDEFGEDLDDVLGRLGDVPVLLYTRSEVDDASAELNETIRDRAGDRTNVLLVDWGRAVAEEQELELVDDDGLPTIAGMERITLLTAGALGESPTGAGGLCFEPTFTDDSAIIL